MKTRILITALWAAATLCACRNAETNTNEALSAAETSAPAAVSTAHPAADFPAPNPQWAQLAPLAHTPLNAAKLAPQEFEVEADEPATFTTRAGFQFNVPAGAFVDAAGRPFTGQATITVREAVTVQDFIRSGLMTMAGDTPLRSGGMFQFTATDAATGSALSLARGKYIPGQTPVLDREYKLFRGRQTANGALDWINPVNMQSNTPSFAISRQSITRLPSITFAKTSLIQLDGEVSAKIIQLLQDYDTLEELQFIQHIARNKNLNEAVKQNRFWLEQLAWANAHPATSTDEILTVLRTQNTRRILPFHLVKVGTQYFTERRAFQYLPIKTQFAGLQAEGLIQPVQSANAAIRREWVNVTSFVHAFNAFARITTVFEYPTPNPGRGNDRNNTVAKFWAKIERESDLWRTRTVTSEELNRIARGSLSIADSVLASTKLFECQGKVFFRIRDLSILSLCYRLQPTPIISLVYKNSVSESPTNWYSNIQTANLKKLFIAAPQYIGFLRLNEDTVLTATWDQTRTRAYELREIFYKNREAELVREANLSSGLSSRYGFSINELGWYNCDIYMREPWQPQEVIVQLNGQQTRENTQLYVVYPTERMVFQFPINADGTANVRLFDNYQGQLLLVSGERANSIAARRQPQPLTVAWQGAGALTNAIASR